jgi:hypothetical protein
MKVHTGSGTVTVYLPASFAGDADARTSDGKIDSEVSLPISGRVDPRHVRGTSAPRSAQAAARDWTSMWARQRCSCDTSRTGTPPC